MTLYFSVYTNMIVDLVSTVSVVKTYIWYFSLQTCTVVSPTQLLCMIPELTTVTSGTSLDQVEGPQYLLL